MRRITMTLLLLCVAADLSAWSSPNKAEGCESLAPVPINYNVDFFADIQPLLEQRCASCHTSISLGNFNVLVENAKESMLGIDESGAESGYPGFRRIVPGSPQQSLVFLRINCSNAGTPDAIIPRMPPGPTPTDLDLQALMNDWIALGSIMRGSTPATRTDRQFLGNFESLR